MVKKFNQYIQPALAAMVLFILVFKGIISSMDRRAGDEMLDYLITWVPVIIANVLFLILAALWGVTKRSGSNASNTFYFSKTMWPIDILNLLIGTLWLYLFCAAILNASFILTTELRLYWAFILLYALAIALVLKSNRFHITGVFVQVTVLASAIWALSQSLQRLVILSAF